MSSTGDGADAGARGWARRRLPLWLRAVYHPQELPPWAGPALTLILVVTSLARADDYLSRPTPDAPVLAYVEIIGVRTWGWGFLAVGVGLAVALLSRGLAPLVVAHAAGIGLYAGYTMALLQGFLSTDGASVRGLATVFAGLAVHTIRVVGLSREVKAIAGTREGRVRNRPALPPGG